MTPPLSDYSTQRARLDEQRRRKLRRAMLAQWQTVHATIDAEKGAAVKGIGDAEWKAAQNDEAMNAA